MENLKISLIQADLLWENVPGNLRATGDMIDSIPDDTDLILLPEMFSTGFSMHPERCAEPMDGPAFQFLMTKAAEKNCLVIGSILTEEQGHYYNRLISMKPDGTHEQYDKRHLFRLSDEHKVMTGGTTKIIVRWKGWNILPMVCYDLRFPVWIRNRWDGNAYEYDLAVFPANWPASRSHVWKNLLVARAIENISYVAGVNRTGKDGEGTLHSGESLIISPKGNIVAMGDTGKSIIVHETLSGSDLVLFRKSFNIGADWDRFILET